MPRNADPGKHWVELKIFIMVIKTQSLKYIVWHAAFQLPGQIEPRFAFIVPAFLKYQMIHGGEIVCMFDKITTSSINKHYRG
jgi:hypothetical protein